jgi:ketosteroid isomerase-like protein
VGLAARSRPRYAGAGTDENWRNSQGAPILDTFDEVQLEPQELIDAGADQVVAVVRFSGRAKLSGIDSELTYAEVSTIRDGKIAQGRQYWTRDEALEVAGLSE